MSEYKGIKGFQVTTRTEDPVPYAQALADNPYAGAWSSGGNLNTARNAIVSISHGSESSGLVFGGNPLTGKTEKYDGSSWAESGDLNTSRNRTSGAGTQTSAIAAGGYAPPGAQDVAEEFNGSSWTEIAEANSSRFAGYGWGANAEAVVIVAGSTASTDFPAGALTEQWNGSAWTETGDLNTARNFTAGFGTSYTSGIIAGGSTASGNDVGNAESFNGSSWTEVSDLNTTRTQIAGYGTDSDDGYIVGGYNYGPNAGSANTESWNGSSWTEVADLSTARWDLSAGGGPGSSIAAGGQPASSPNTNATEEWTFSGLDPSTTPAADYANAITGDFYYNSTTGQFKTVNDGGAPIGTWASGGNMNSGRAYHGAAGTQTAALAISGAPTPPFTYVANVENYNGSTWTEIADVNGARHEASGFGTTTAAIYAAGYGPNSLTPTERTDKVESWNGSSWTEVAETNEIKNIMGSGGSSTAGIIYGGALAPQPAPVATANVEYWNGSGWSEQTNMNQARSYLAGFGTQTSITAAGGHIGTSGTNLQNVVETWDGTSWTEVSEINNSRAQYASSGTSSPNGLIFTGSTGPASGVNNCEHWNGSSWTEINDVSTAVRTAGRGPVGTSTSALKFGGFANPATTASTEEFTAEDFQIKTVTTS